MNSVVEKENILEDTTILDEAEAVIAHANEETKSNHLKKALLFVVLPITILLLLLLVFSTVFAFLNYNHDTIIHGIFIQGIDVSKLTKEEATEKVTSIMIERLSTEITLQHNDYELKLLPSQFSVNYDIGTAVDMAYMIGRKGNIFEDNFSILSTLSSNAKIGVNFEYNDEQLTAFINNINEALPDHIIEPSYAVEDNQVVITNGRDGVIVDTVLLKSLILSYLTNIQNTSNIVKIPVQSKKASTINLDQIYQEIHKDPVDAYYSKDPYVVHPHVNGMDFKISLDEAKAMIANYQEQYVIELKTLYPNITTSQIGTEAFPDLLSQFSTSYSTGNSNRANNLTLAAKKVNGTVLMPGETFSYNQVVGKRTAQAGFKSAAAYSGGEVVDSIGGGICQISSTLYNAVLYANLEIVERTNHGFNPGYVKAGTDATVSWGSPDFKFKNNRNYPIKIVSYASGGTANFKIFGLKQDNDCIVEIQANTIASIPYKTIYQNDASLAKGKTKVIQSGSNGCKTETYKILKKQDGTVISKTRISRDTYNPHNKVVAQGTK